MVAGPTFVSENATCDSQCGSMTSSTRVLVLQRIIVQRKPQRFNKTNETDAEAELANS